MPMGGQLTFASSGGKANRADPGASKLRGVDEEVKHEKNAIDDDHDSVGDCLCVADDIGVLSG